MELSMKLQNAHPLKSFIVQFREIRKNTRQGSSISIPTIHIYTFVTRRQILPLGKIVEKVRSEKSVERSNRRKEKRKTLSPRWKISSLLVPLLTLEPMLSVQKAKIGRGNTEMMASSVFPWRKRNSRDGASINEFPVVHRPKMAPW